MRRLILVAAAVAALLPTLALADGKFYSPRAPAEEVPPHIPYQRALITHDGTRELLILQSKFEGRAEDFGWVVPLPAVPKLVGMAEKDVQLLFRELDWYSRPRVVKPGETLGLLLVLFFLASLGALIIFPVLQLVWKRRGKRFPKFLSVTSSRATGLVLLLLIILVMGMAIPNTIESRSSAGIDVLSAQQVGIYDAKVIRARDSGDMIAWLNEHDYRFDDTDKNAFDNYIKRGWCFVTACINLEKAGKERVSDWEGMVLPLAMLFETKEAVYPLTLTGTGGKETEVLLYIFAQHKVVDPLGRFALRFAGKEAACMAVLGSQFDPPLFNDKYGQYFYFNPFPDYMVKLKARLMPEAMKEDLILRPAPDDDSYRERVVVW
jgi:hypothetical protein